jgi:hypothetical protein
MSDDVQPHEIRYLRGLVRNAAWSGYVSVNADCLRKLLVRVQQQADEIAALRAERDRLKAALEERPADWDEFAVGAFCEGWAARQSGEFQTLPEAWRESHVRLELQTKGHDTQDFDSRFGRQPEDA